MSSACPADPTRPPRSHRSRRPATAGGTALALALLMPAAALAGEPASPLSWTAGDGSHLTVGGWLMADFQAFPRTETGYGASWDATFRLRAAHLSLRFRWGDALCGRLDGELSGAEPDLQDAWIEYCGLAPWFQVRAGRLRVPFGGVQQTQSPDLLLLEPPMVAGNPKDFRDVGVQVYGTLWDDRIRWAVAAVTGSRDLAVDVNDLPDVTGRLTVHPLLGQGDWFRGLHLGGSASWGEGPTRHGFRGRTMTDYTFQPPPTVRGVRWRAGAELAWVTPYFRIAAEYQILSHDREGVTDAQRIEGATVVVGDLDAYRVWGWWVEASGLVWGEPGADGTPVHGLEVAARWEVLEMGDGDRRVPVGGGEERHGPLEESDLQAVTAGLNVHLGRGVRLTLAYQGIRYGRAELASDWEEGDPETGPAWVHSAFLRGRFAF